MSFERRPANPFNSAPVRPSVSAVPRVPAKMKLTVQVLRSWKGMKVGLWGEREREREMMLFIGT